MRSFGIGGMGCFVFADTREPSVPVLLQPGIAEKLLVAFSRFSQKLNLGLGICFRRRFDLAFNGGNKRLGFIFVPAVRVSFNDALKCVESLCFIGWLVGFFV